MRTPPRSKVPQSYDQPLRPPFLVTQMPAHVCIWDVENLGDAVDEFVRYCIPPSPGGAAITDADGVIAIAYTFELFAEHPVRWAGTRETVDLLRQHCLVEPGLMVSIEMALEPV